MRKNVQDENKPRNLGLFRVKSVVYCSSQFSPPGSEEEVPEKTLHLKDEILLVSYLPLKSLQFLPPTL